MAFSRTGLVLLLLFLIKGTKPVLNSASACFLGFSLYTVNEMKEHLGTRLIYLHQCLKLVPYNHGLNDKIDYVQTNIIYILVLKGSSSNTPLDDFFERFIVHILACYTSNINLLTCKWQSYVQCTSFIHLTL